MSDVNKINLGDTTLTVGKSFCENFSGDVETGSVDAAGNVEAMTPLATSSVPPARESKRPIGWIIGGTAALLLIVGLAVGMPKSNDALETSATTAAAVPEPVAPTVILEDGSSKDADNASNNALGGSNIFEPEETIGDAALLVWTDANTSSSPIESPPDSQSSLPSNGPSASPSTLEPSKSPTEEPTNSPSASPSDNPTSKPTNEPTLAPSKSPIIMLDVSSWAGLSHGWDFEPSASPTKEPTSSPTAQPTKLPTSLPTSLPTLEPTPEPSTSPTIAPTEEPTSAPTDVPSSIPSDSPTQITDAPTLGNPFFMGDSFVTNKDLGIEHSAGISVRLIARTGQKVQFANGEKSKRSWHSRSDGAGIIPLNPENPLEEGYVYVSNSEESDGGGGVYGAYFDKDGNMYDYKALLTGTTDNCGGGLTPWNTWVTCEEYSDGQCWQVDPINERTKVTKLGGNGGRYESVAVDNRDPNRPVFFTTEDDSEGALRRFEANGNGWDALHSNGKTTFLNILKGNTFEWTTDEDDGRSSASKHFPNTEGIAVHEGKVYFMTKEFKRLIILDLENMTYETEGTGKKFYGEGTFGDQPDQNMFGPSRKYIYFTEDGGSSPGVYARYGSDGTYFTMFQAIQGGMHDDDETAGIALSPDNKRFYATIQHSGYILEFTRDDGLAFE